ncbi:putative endonuclease lcl3 [Scheffersomyces spartinae]|uniref:Probable endonuclease LCL3 n=1 Tax=Scheffersomyces spartinae TaxID=45513 RepID=A0A9P7VBG6_9ASCO|nr:putative endonuclease lcl3 [Scheffersomyces spartinae]KAG7194847.1 putative endonuclease lcl3 [Scheffersomyces spartinae]
MDDSIGLLHPQVLLLSGGLVSCVLLGLRVYHRYIKRVSTYLELTPRMLQNGHKMYGRVTRVGDGDNFRFFHTPGGIKGGWGWLRKVPALPKELKDQTLLIRLCGIDAPERAHFGNKAQPYSEEALNWLKNYILQRNVRITPYSIDQYKRVVARCQVWTWTGLRDVSAEMVRNGMAVVYESKATAEFGDSELKYRTLEAKAKRQGKGLWSLGNKLVTPGEYKRETK